MFRSTKTHLLFVALPFAAALTGCSASENTHGTDAGTDIQGTDVLAEPVIETGLPEATDVQSEPEAADPCNTPPPPEALVKSGPYDGGLYEGGYVIPGGRAVTPAGPRTVVGGFPIDIQLHPTLPIAYLENSGNSIRAVQVVNLESNTLVQEVDRTDAYKGIAISPDGKKLYASGGNAGVVDVYDVAADGKLAAAAQISISNYPAGLAVSPDGTKLWVGEFRGTIYDVVEVDTTTLQTNRSFLLTFGAYSLAYVPKTNELYASGFASTEVAVINLDLGIVVATPTVGQDPMGLAVSPDGSRVYVGVTVPDKVVAINTTSHAVVAQQGVGDPGIAPPGGAPYPADSPSALALDPMTNRLYVVQAADNYVQVFSTPDLTSLGSIPVDWYPTAVAVGADKHLVVTNGKGISTGPMPGHGDPDPDGKSRMRGTITNVDLSTIDLDSATSQAKANVLRPSLVYPYACDKNPVPLKVGDPSPIKHIILVVRENKTYDAYLGDIGKGDSDPNSVLFGKDITPNLHALANQFAHHDNFYDDSETSSQGHLWLTSSFVVDYWERNWIQNDSAWEQDIELAQGRPSWLSFFTHLMANNIDYKMFGEVTSTTDSYNGTTVLSHADLNYPGVFFTLSVLDQDRATYLQSQIASWDTMPPFMYVTLIRDHTYGLSAGEPTPESMVSDNDYATGLFVDAVTKSKFWDSTAIFIVEDDPQIGSDHVDYHRSICMVVSPWAKPGYISSVHLSYPSLFKTFELILGLQPMCKYDDLATPMWDAFDVQPHPGTYNGLPRTVPAGNTNPSDGIGAQISSRMDFSAPDRNPDLGDLLVWARKGTVTKGSNLERALKGNLNAIRTVKHDDD